MKKNIFVVFIILITFLTSCMESDGFDKENPVTITLWHNYGGQMQETMDVLVGEFNNTVGKDEGIIVNVTSISGSATLHDKLVAAAKGDPGASGLPDIATCYPKTAVLLKQEDKLVDLNTFFSSEEMEKYVEEFLIEGEFQGGQYVFPIAKSTEVLFVNKTIFEKFSQETGIAMNTLETFEGISQAAQEYYEWSGGKAFFTSDSWFNYAQIGMQQMSDELLKEEELNYSDNYHRIWENFYQPMIKGGYAIYDGYSSDLAKTGEIVCSTGSTAGILFYGNTITYPDNTTEEVDYEILPYPVFEGGEKVAIQRGGGMVITKSQEDREKAASVFIKWFTSVENNMRFISQTGYLPVTQEAYESGLEEEMFRTENENIQKLLMVALTMHKEYEFFVPPVFERYDEIQKKFIEYVLQAGLEGKKEYESTQESKEESYRNISRKWEDRLKGEI